MAQILLLTAGHPLPELAEAVAPALPEMVTKLPEEKRRFVETVLANYGGIVLTATLEESDSLYQ